MALQQLTLNWPLRRARPVVVQQNRLNERGQPSLTHTLHHTSTPTFAQTYSWPGILLSLLSPPSMAQPAPPPHHQPAAQARNQGSPMPMDDRERTANNTPPLLTNGQGQSRIPGQGFGPQPASPWLDPSSHTSHLGRPEPNHNQNSPQQSHSPFPPPFLHPNLAHLMQQTHMQQMMHQQHSQFLDPSKTQPPGLGSDSLGGRHPQQEHTSDQWHSQQRAFDKGAAGTIEESSVTAGSDVSTPDHGAQAGLQQAGERRQFPTDRRSMDAQLRQGIFHPLAQHPQSMFPGPPGFEGEFGPPGMIPMHTPNGIVFVPMNRVTPPPPPPGFGHFPVHTPDQERLASHQHPGPQFQPTLQQQQLFHQQQMFMHQQLLRQQHQLQQMYQFQNGPQHPLQQDQQQQQQQEQQRTGASMSGGKNGQEQQQQQNHQIKNIESHINQLLFQGGGVDGPSTAPAVAALDGPRLTVQEIEEAQVKDLQGQFRRFSLGDPVSPPRSRSIPSAADHISGEGSQIQGEHLSSQSPASSQQFSTMIHSRFQDPSTTRYEQPVDKAPFSVKDIDFYSDRKYDPYRPTNFDQITRDAKDFCQELMPKPEEETRKLALLQRYVDSC